VLGVVENMAYLSCPHCGERVEVFHRGQVSRAVTDDSLPLLAEIPLDPLISAAADSGRPVVVTNPDGLQSRAFISLASSVASRLLSTE
jgi:ATP-binding protein involved in chromosome partitioning